MCALCSPAVHHVRTQLGACYCVVGREIAEGGIEIAKGDVEINHGGPEWTRLAKVPATPPPTGAAMLDVYGYVWNCPTERIAELFSTGALQRMAHGIRVGTLPPRGFQF